jgi:hypothetical protein
MAIDTIPAAPIKKKPRVRSEKLATVTSLQEVRFARHAQERVPPLNPDSRLLDGNGEERRCLWVSMRESNLLSTMYEGRLEDALAMVRAMMKRA